MEYRELKQMRIKQFLAVNGILFLLLTIFTTILYVLEFKMTHMFILLGIMLLISSIYGFIKGESTKSFIPILEQVAIYEKEKMGPEWKKQYKVGHFCNLLLSGFMFLQAYLTLKDTDPLFDVDIVFLVALVFIFAIILNISFLLHIRKVDQSYSSMDFIGYTKKQTTIWAIVGTLVGFMMVVMVVCYVLLTTYI
ncbi:hypothetical protein [Rossellomorea sp. BNER]|uniref:hypothetical protein n=1 Tax=Rossellomorea sp. BNER TaxID=2962031 RepID=UPI003AF2F95C|nr:hypothetical protein [Rossellomorea sp. BNER]